MTTRYEKTHFVELVGASVDSATGTLSWTSTRDHQQTEDVVDRDEDGLLDRDFDVWQTTAYTFTGYTVDLDGKTFGIFSNGSYWLIPYNKADYDAFAAIESAGSTTEFHDEIAAANCFLTGTRLATPDGPCPIETLAPGDRVLDAGGVSHPILWVAQRTVRTVPWLSEGLLPVRIARNAFGPGRPRRDLLLSADHGLVLHGLVVNAGALVDGDRIRFEPLGAMPERFTYWHVETEAHIALMAEGVPAESFIDYAGRAAFDNHQDYLDRYGTDRIIREMPLPRISSKRHLPPGFGAGLDYGEKRVA